MAFVLPPVTRREKKDTQLSSSLQWIDSEKPCYRGASTCGERVIGRKAVRAKLIADLRKPLLQHGEAVNVHALAKQQLTTLEKANKVQTELRAARAKALTVLKKRAQKAMTEEDYDLAKELKFEIEVAEKVANEDLRRLRTRQHVFKPVLYQTAFCTEMLLRVCEYLAVESMPSFRGVSKLLRGVLQARLSTDWHLRVAVDKHTLALAKKATRQPWVSVRVRPVPSQNRFQVAGRRILVEAPVDRNAPSARQSEDFFFDDVFDVSASQLDVWASLEVPLLRCVVARQHACLLAYGQTGSGKTFTMFGDDSDNGEGVAVRAVRRIASMLRRALGRDPSLNQTLTVDFSFLEIYNECIFDLLDGQRQLQCTRQNATATVPAGTTKLKCPLDAMEASVSAWLRAGVASRTVGETIFNATSSRSHAVATIYINWQPGTQSRIFLVDLAGSERAGKYALSNESLREGNHINQGLAALGRVVGAVAQGKGAHVPVRDSALTWLLTDAITAQDGRAFMFATVNPESLPETMSTLHYAKQFSNLKAKGGADVARHGKALRSLQVEVSMHQHEFDDMADKLRPQDKVWTKSKLMHGGVRTNSDTMAMVEEHPLLEWTEMHDRVSCSDVGCVRITAESPPLRSDSDPPDGRITAPPLPPAREFMKFLSPKVIRTPRVTSSPVVEVIFDGMRHKEPIVLWYPKAALERVPPPRGLEPLASLAHKLYMAEENLKKARQEMQIVQARHKEDQQRLVDLSQPPSLNDF